MGYTGIFCRRISAFYNRNRTGDLMSRQTGDMMAIRHFVAYVIYNLYENALLFFIALVMIFSVDYRIGLAMVIVLPVTAYVTFKQSKRSNRNLCMSEISFPV
jgi:ATP-binding cassette subfamily B protein